MPERWFYEAGGERRGPLDREALQGMLAGGTIRSTTLVWREGLPDWMPAGAVPGLLPAGTPAAPQRLRHTVPPLPKPEPRPEGPGVLTLVATRISALADVPVPTRIPLRDILIGGLGRRTPTEEIERTFDAGTVETTPALAEIESGWPIPRVFWRVLALAVATYLVMRFILSEFQNINDLPGTIVVGAFAVPLAIVVLFFELNTPRNVSVYQVGKMLVLGGALSLFSTSILERLFPGAGAGRLLPALGTGAIEETGKMCALILLVFNRRYRWQLNGLLFGVAVGAGFAGFETAGYALNNSLNKALVRGPADGLFHLDKLFEVISLRGFLSPGGHVIWTGLLGAAIWKVKDDKPFEPRMLVSPVVLRRWLIVVVLHGLWDTQTPYESLRLGLLTLLGWYLVFAVLTEGLDEIETAKKAAAPGS